MATYRRVYDSRHLQADCQEPGSAAEPYTFSNRVRATFTLKPTKCADIVLICAVLSAHLCGYKFTAMRSYANVSKNFKQCVLQ